MAAAQNKRKPYPVHHLSRSIRVDFLPDVSEPAVASPRLYEEAVSLSDSKQGPCAGCVARYDIELCSRLPAYCFIHNTIFVPQRD
jgi:hypothetical protein